MAKTSDVRPIITLACTECKERNYTTTKNRRNTPDRLELNKYCSRCRKETTHRETRQGHAIEIDIWEVWRMPDFFRIYRI